MPQGKSDKMPKLTLIADDSRREVPFSNGSTARELLEAAGLGIRSGCRGNGACGLCLVQIISGNANSPTRNERITLSSEQIERSIRLACQLIPKKDLCIRIVNAAPKSGWRDLGTEPFTPPRLSTGVQFPKVNYGLAVDLGTTHISLSLWDLDPGQRVCGRFGMNPQSYYGTDVVTRLIAAGQSQENARRIALMPLDAVHDALMDMCSRDGFDLRNIREVAIVGNTAMLALLTETDPQILLQPNFWTRLIECRLDNPKTWVSVLGIHPEANVDVISPFAGFVGSDLLAGVLATRLTYHPGGLLIDFGTNSEMALWDGKRLWVTSAAGGPAFEGFQIQCGMPAEEGSIYAVNLKQDSTELHFQVIGGGEAIGLCGSGLVDLIAILRRTERLTRTGKFAMPYLKDGFIIQQVNPTIRLTSGDVDMIQRAKAAIGVGVKTLLTSARMSASELNRIYVCGAFGQNLNILNAQAIGLLPDIPQNHVLLCGNTALAGCERLLMSPTGDKDLLSLRKRATIINLSQVSDFDALFLENLFLQPLAVNET
jgi:uncharacterized 2Fe-2S/4Fe-4S cluster protein (DUF4445 family)